MEFAVVGWNYGQMALISEREPSPLVALVEQARWDVFEGRSPEYEGSGSP
jgi:hypothetical protein